MDFLKYLPAEYLKHNTGIKKSRTTNTGNATTAMPFSGVRQSLPGTTTTRKNPEEVGHFLAGKKPNKTI